jgi:hypothetical protein
VPKMVAGRAAGNDRLAACAPQKSAAPRWRESAFLTKYSFDKSRQDSCSELREAPARWFEIGQVVNRFHDSKAHTSTTQLTPHEIFHSFHSNSIDLSALAGGFCQRFSPAGAHAQGAPK